MDVKTPHALLVRWQWLARLMGLGALVLAIFACGGSVLPEMIPVATLEPGVPAFRVVSLAGSVLQSRAGRDGTLQWETPVGSTSDALLTADAAMHIVYVSATSAPMVTAVSADDGHILWQFTRCVGPDTSVLLGQGHLYLTCSHVAASGSDDVSQATMYALDAATGAVLWIAPQQHARALAGADVITQTTTGLAALNGSTGAVLWRHRVAIGPTPPLAGAFDTFPFVVRLGPVGLYYSPDGNHAEALRTSDGALLWRSGGLQDLTSAPNAGYVQHASVALATADMVVTQGIYGVTALRASDGMILWRYYQYPNGGGIRTLVGEDGTVYVASYFDPTAATPDPKITAKPLAALNPGDGSLRWDVQGPVLNTPLLLQDGDTLLAAEPAYVSAFATASGARRWLQQGVFADHLTADAHVVCVQAGTVLYVLKLADGLKVWKQTLPAAGRTAPLLLSA
jgi:outer membrane protein assembly factor BamB